MPFNNVKRVENLIM